MVTETDQARPPSLSLSVIKIFHLLCCSNLRLSLDSGLSLCQHDRMEREREGGRDGGVTALTHHVVSLHVVHVLSLFYCLCFTAS